MEQASCGVRRAEDPVEYTSLSELTLPLFLPAVLMHMTRAMVITVLPLHMLWLGMSYGDVGMFSTIGGLGMMFGNIPAGAFITYCGPRAALVLACGLYIIAAAFASLAARGSAAMWPLLGAFLFLGCGESTAVLARQTFTGATVPRSLRGRAASSLGGAQRFGYTVAPLVGGLVAHWAGLRAVCAVQAAMASAAILVILRCVPSVKANQDLSRKGEARPAHEEDEEPPSMLQVARSHWRSLLIVSVFSGSLTCMRKARELLFSLEGHAQHLTQAQVGGIAAVSYLVDATLFPLAGVLLDTKGRTWTASTSLAASASAMLILVFSTPSAVLAFGLVAGAANGISAGSVLTLGADLAPPESRGHFLALFRTLSRTYDVAAPSVLGLLARYSSLPMAEVALCVAGALSAVWVRCYVPEARREEPAASVDSTAGEGTAPMLQGMQSEDTDIDKCEDQSISNLRAGHGAGCPLEGGKRSLRLTEAAMGDSPRTTPQTSPRCTPRSSPGASPLSGQRALPV